jgi:hypothetical protein
LLKKTSRNIVASLACNHAEALAFNLRDVIDYLRHAQLGLMLAKIHTAVNFAQYHVHLIEGADKINENTGILM